MRIWRRPRRSCRQLEIIQRQSANRLCILLGHDAARSGSRNLARRRSRSRRRKFRSAFRPILLRRRPDVRRAERQAAAQCANIGVAESEFYPHISIVGTLGWSSEDLGNLFNEAVVPRLGRTELPMEHPQLLPPAEQCAAAGRDVPGTRHHLSADGARSRTAKWKTRWCRSSSRTNGCGRSTKARGPGATARRCSTTQYEGQMIDYTPVGYFAQNLLEQQDLAAQAQGDVALALVEMYRAMGGGWQIRLARGPMRRRSRFRSTCRRRRRNPARRIAPLVPTTVQDSTRCRSQRRRHARRRGRTEGRRRRWKSCRRPSRG